MGPDPLPTDMPLEPIPGYRLVRRLGRGGFGEVWEADGPGEIHVALKFVSIGGPVGDHELRALELVKNVRHAHLLSLFGAWHVAGRLVIAMELAERTLLDRLREATQQGQPGVPGPELLEYMREAAKGIDFLNEPRHRGAGPQPVCIQHRDIKPQNLLLVGGSVKVGDFGLARLLEHSITAHSGGLTPAYAAPEFFEGRTASQSDQYSLAVTYCHLRGNRRPFTGDAAALVAGHLYQEPVLTMLPPEERPVVARALAKNPSERWRSCQVFVRALADSGGAEAVVGFGSGHTGAEPDEDPSDQVLRRLRPREVSRPPARQPVRQPRGSAGLDHKGVLVLLLLLLPSALFLSLWSEFGVKVAAAVTLGTLPLWPLGVRSGVWNQVIDLFGKAEGLSRLENDGTWLASKRARLFGSCFVTYFFLSPGFCFVCWLVLNAAYPPAAFYVDRGSAWFRAGDAEMALHDLKAALEMDPNNVKAYRVRAQVLARLGDWEEALKDHNKAIRLEPKNADLYVERSKTYEAKGDAAQAEQDLERARKLGHKR